MPLKFVFGPSGSGKSTYLYQHVIEESEKYPLKNFIVLVPEQFTMQTQKDLVSMHPRHGIMNIDVLSFARLAYRVFEETGTKQMQVLDDEGKNLILRKIAGDYENKLTVLKGNIKKLGGKMKQDIAYTYGLRTPCKFKIQIWESPFLVQRILRRYCRENAKKIQEYIQNQLHWSIDLCILSL